MADKEITKEKVTLFNQGQRTYHTSAGPLLPGESIEVSAKEAASLMDYRDVVDMARVAPSTAKKIDQLMAENAQLKAENEQLKADAEGEKTKGKK